MDWCHARALGTPSAIPVLGMTSLGKPDKTRKERILGKLDIETRAVLIRKNAGSTRVIVIQIQSVMDH